MEGKLNRKLQAEREVLEVVIWMKSNVAGARNAEGNPSLAQPGAQ